MKKIILLIGLFAACHAHSAEWLTDLPSALAKAKSENKAVLLDFTGSDWCIWCKRLKGEVFDQKEFQNFADQNLILVELDFPNSKPMSAGQRNANDALARSYGITGYPTVIVIDSDRKTLGKTGYIPGGPKPFIAQLGRIIPGLKAGAAAPVAVHGNDPLAAPGKKAEIPPAPMPIKYGELALKAISGNAGKRLALINNQTLAQGESGMVKVGEKKVKVLCQEIRENSVLLQVDDQPKAVELQLGQTKQIEKTAHK